MRTLGIRRWAMAVAAAALPLALMSLETVEAQGAPYPNKFACTTLSVERDAAGKTIAVSVTVSPDDPQFPQWQSWLVASAGETVKLSQTASGAKPMDAARLDTVTRDDARLELEAVGRLSFQPSADQKIFVWYR